MSADLARALVAAYPDVWEAGILAHWWETEVLADGTTGAIAERWWRFIGDSPSAAMLAGNPEPVLTDPATAGVLLARLRREWCRPGRWLNLLVNGDTVTIELFDDDAGGGRHRVAPTLGEAAAAALVALRGGG